MPCGARRKADRVVSFSPAQERARRLLEGPQRYTCLAGGTRSGKTFLIVRAIVVRALKAPESRHVILRFHANAARASISLDTLPTVMRLCFPRSKLKKHRQDGFFALPNGARIWVGGLDDKERVEKILGLEYASFFLNNDENLAPEFIESLAHLPERQRKRFYEGLYVDELEGALWTYEAIGAARCKPEDIPEAERAAVVVALDPSGAAGHDDLGADEIGIVVAARGANGDCYILADRSCREAPSVWGRRAVTAYHEFRADCVVAEANFGGEMVRATIHAADPNVPVHLVTASRGKAIRAEPISVRYAQKQVHHAGRFAKLEDQLCAFTPAGFGGTGSPDHADAAIWALTYLFDMGGGVGIIEFYRRETSR